MKKVITKLVEIDICDTCNKHADLPYYCFACGMCACWDCCKKVLIEYNHAVYFNGSNDGYYCLPCDAKLCDDESDDLHNAYVEVRGMREEYKFFAAEFDRRRTAIENQIEVLYNARKK